MKANTGMLVPNNFASKHKQIANLWNDKVMIIS